MKKHVMPFTVIFLLASVPAFSQKNSFKSFSASKAEYFEGHENFLNEESPIFIYPVHLVWEGDFEPNGKFSIICSQGDSDSTDDSDCTSNPDYLCNSEKKVKTLSVNEAATEDNGRYEFFFEEDENQAEKKFTFQITYEDSHGKISESETDTGWGALSPTLYFLTYDRNVKKSHAKLTLMHKPNIFDKMGKETVHGAISGTLGYKTQVQGVSGVVPMPYKNYSDSPEWILDGLMQTKANIFGNGIMSGTVTVKGMYPGKICYDHVIISEQKAGGGYYEVEPLGATKTNIDYSYTFQGDIK